MPHRMFLGCLILTTKYLLDEPPTSSLWVQCLMLSCNNLFLTEEGVLALELDILKECKWRADIHEHDLLSELGLFMEFMKVAVEAGTSKVDCDLDKAMVHEEEKRTPKENFD
ncbi:hypothetical protein H634G_11296 [Metarhizium anisopliae BRIP 53293]|uniref:Cyclin N-terminal domain-containing protein n=1 Tax=Metarhizium anisopliae BRIP 53293 TaxID=1291518 RepID=A0A0D9NHQ5_METAN|nr:hypothetical protein H634G_11296 [Metarhizium anisopliae BRIP 53293]KJK84982.1 hypothetical protein H633G_11190 [Metarhizium anisopliae BRIP 53284]